MRIPTGKPGLCQQPSAALGHRGWPRGPQSGLAAATCSRLRGVAFFADKATSQLLLETDWESILQICDMIRQGDTQ